LMRGGYSPFTPRASTNHHAAFVIMRSQIASSPTSKVPRRRFHRTSGWTLAESASGPPSHSFPAGEGTSLVRAARRPPADWPGLVPDGFGTAAGSISPGSRPLSNVAKRLRAVPVARPDGRSRPIGPTDRDDVPVQLDGRIGATSDVSWSSSSSADAPLPRRKSSAQCPRRRRPPLFRFGSREAFQSEIGPEAPKSRAVGA
jgi:hypothetical protein